LSLFESSACTEVAKLAIQTGKIAMYAKRIFARYRDNMERTHRFQSELPRLSPRQSQ
jgi:hypothetical protein